MATPKRSRFGIQLPRHILKFATTENHNKYEISVVDPNWLWIGFQESWRMGEGTNERRNERCQNFCLFPNMQRSRNAENRGKARIQIGSLRYGDYGLRTGRALSFVRL